MLRYKCICDVPGKVHPQCKADAHLASPPAPSSLSAFGSEIIIAVWEASAAQCDATADQFAAVTQHLVCSFREKARAYRKCIEDLRRQMEHESKRQPTQRNTSNPPA